MEVCKRIRDKLDGSDPDPLTQCSIVEQVRFLISIFRLELDVDFHNRSVIRFEKRQMLRIWLHSMKDGHLGCEKIKMKHATIDRRRRNKFESINHQVSDGRHPEETFIHSY